MSKETCILTTKDYTILEVLLDRHRDGDLPMRRLLRRKIDTAIVVFRDDVPPAVATLGSRVRYRVDDAAAETRFLAHDRMPAPKGLFLPITTVRGLALLGLCEEQAIAVETGDAAREKIRLEQVVEQPEALRRERDLSDEPASGEGARFRTIERAFRAGPAGPDDPGPSAA